VMTSNVEATRQKRCPFVNLLWAQDSGPQEDMLSDQQFAAFADGRADETRDRKCLQEDVDGSQGQCRRSCLFRTNGENGIRKWDVKGGLERPMIRRILSGTAKRRNEPRPEGKRGSRGREVGAAANSHDGRLQQLVRRRKAVSGEVSGTGFLEKRPEGFSTPGKGGGMTFRMAT